VTDGAACPSPLVGVEVQWSALVLSEEVPVPNRKLICYIQTHTLLTMPNMGER
jgi:hypothetical protein